MPDADPDLLDWRDPRTPRGVLVRADTGEAVRWARWANLRTGEYEAWTRDPESLRPVLDDLRRNGVPLSAFRRRGKAPLRFVPGPALAPRPTPPGELAAMVADERRATPCLVVPGRDCEEPGCRRPAEYETADERQLAPAVAGDGRACDVGIVVRKRRWCSAHYRPPVSTSRRGVESEVEVTVARPQW